MWSPPDAAALIAPSTSPPPPVFRRLEPIPLKPGLNHVGRLSPDGRDGAILSVAARVDTGGQRHTDYLVMLDPGAGEHEPSVVTLEEPPAYAPSLSSDMVSDAPHTDDDQVRSIRFAFSGVSRGRRTLMLIAQRDMAEAHTMPSATHVDLQVYTLVIRPHGGNFESFVSSWWGRTRACFANADLALQAVFRLPLPRGYEGPASSGVCGED